MAVDPRYYYYQQRRRHLKDFDRRAKTVLSDGERKHLYGILKGYQSHHQVEQLVSSLQMALDTPTKMDLLLDLRHFIPSSHLSRFDQVAPYHKMAHPISITSGNDGNLNQMQTYNSLGRLYTQRNPKYSASPHRSLGRRTRSAASSPLLPRQTQATHSWDNINDDAVGESPLITVVLVREADENLGFSIRGGSEHGLGIYVSEMIEDSAADCCGLEPGDQVMEVNSVTFENIASSSAVKVLTGTLRLKMIIRRIGKIPGFKFAKEKTSWYDTGEDRVIEGEFEDQSTIHSPAALPYVDGTVQRRVHLTVENDDQFLGFNIRGGSEYGLGIYVSRIDHGGIGEQQGLKVGDQVLDVNGKSFHNVTHAAAVDILRSNLTLIMTVKDVGKYPAYKEIYAEYSWTDTMTGRTTHSRIHRKHSFGSGLITSIPVRSSPVEELRDIYSVYDPDTNLGSYSQAQYADDFLEEDDLDNHVVYEDADASHHDNRDHSLSSSPSDQFVENGARSPEHDDGGYYNNNEDLSEEVEQIMTFPEAASLTALVPDRSSPSDGNSTDGGPCYAHLEDVSEQAESMLVPHSRDVILQERVAEETGSMKGKLAKKKEKYVPRSQVGVLALQLENTPGGIRNASKANLELIQTLRERGDVNPRQFEDIELTTKKSRTFREMIFGTMSRTKVWQGLQVSKAKTRKPLSNIAFSSDKHQSSPESERHTDVNAEEKEHEERDPTEELGSEVMPDDVTQGHGLPTLINSANRILHKDEVDAVSRYLRKYEDTGSITDLMTPLLAILDSRDKRMLLKDIREVVKPSDLAQFDEMVSSAEVNDKPKLTSQTDVMSSPAKTRVPTTGGHYKVVKEGKQAGVRSGQQLSSQPDHREYLAELARKKRNSLIGIETTPPTETYGRVSQHYNVNSPSNSNYTLNLHRPKGRSKLYKAVVGETRKNAKTDQTGAGRGSPGSSSSGSHASVVEISVEAGDRETLSVQMDLTAEVDGGGESLESSVVSLRSSSLPDRTAFTYSGQDLTSSQATSSSRWSNVYDTVDGVQPEDRDVVLLSKGPVGEAGTPSNFSDAGAALDFLDDLESGSICSVQMSPRTNASSSRASSPGCGSYDVSTYPDHDSDQFDSWRRNRPVFVPPPPPSDPPPSDPLYSDPLPSDHAPPEVCDEDEWSAWITEDVSTEIMRDDDVGKIPHDFPQESVFPSSSTTHDSPQESGFTTHDSPQESVFTAQDDTRTSTPEVTRMPVPATDLDMGLNPVDPAQAKSERKEEPKPQVNSLRDTLRARRKGAPRTSITNPGVFIPLEDLFPPEWGFQAPQTYNHQKPGLEGPAVTSRDPGRTPPVSPSPRSSRPSPPGWHSPDPPGSGHSSPVYQEVGRTPSLTSSSHPSPGHYHQVEVSREELETFMTPPKPKGELYLEQLRTVSTARQSVDSAVTEAAVRVVLSKKNASLGLSISGGHNSRTQPQVKIQKIYPGGAAAEDGILQAGMRVLAIDGRSLSDVTHPKAVDIIRRAYADKSTPHMELLVLP